jgi:hypothetical protein
VRQLAAAFLGRKLASGPTPSKLGTQKRQQAAALQSASRQQLFPSEVPEKAQAFLGWNRGVPLRLLGGAPPLE